MDELTIEDKKYLSSKRAAQITGYAKDYVGQLCREGRVEARLVGRNWYILESSIMEHRFGTEEASESPAPSKTELDATWKTPNYSPESIQTVPELTTKDPSTASQPRWPQDNQVVLSDMQSAWKEWFRNQGKEEEKMLPDASEMLLPEPETVPEPIQELVAEESVDLTQFEAVEASPEEEVEEIHISRISEPEITPVPLTRPSMGDVIDIRRPLPPTRQSAYEEPQQEEYVEEAYEAPRTRKVTRREARRQRVPFAGGFAVQAVFISVACLAVVVAIIGSGFADSFLQRGNASNPVSNFLGGVSAVENNK